MHSLFLGQLMECLTIKENEILKNVFIIL